MGEILSFAADCLPDDSDTEDSHIHKQEPDNPYIRLRSRYCNG